MNKLKLYRMQSERAAADIKTWPEWMQRNLKPATRTMYTEREKDLAWAAGFLDGEGYIGLVRASPKTFTLRLSVEQIDFRPLLKLKSLFGGTVKPQADRRINSRPIFIWIIYANNAGKSLAQMLPFLVVKKEQAELALEYRSLVGKPGQKYAPETLQKFTDIQTKLQALKKRSWDKEWVD